MKRSIILGLSIALIGGAVLVLVRDADQKQKRKIASYKLKYASESDEYIEQYKEWLRSAPEEWSPLALEQNGHNKAKTASQLRQEQQERLKADLDKLAAGEMDAHPFANALYGGNWQKEVDKYKRHKERSEFIFTASVVCTSIGGTISAWCLLVLTARLILRGLSRIQGLYAAILRYYRKIRDQQLCEVYAQQSEQTSITRPKQQRRKLKRRSDPIAESGWYDLQRDSQDQQQSASQTAVSVSSDSFLKDAGGAKNTATLLSDEKSMEPEATQTTSANEAPSEVIQNPPDTVLQVERDNSVETEGSLKAHAENLEKQIIEFRQMAQSVRQTAVEHSQPLNNTLQELTQQVSAIREYAAHQQEKVERLQDGYDWNIIKTFCLRIIRCIDNLENRISCLSEQNIEATQLKEVKDELLFTIESSGIEQFKPQINSDYRGQEKYAEAAKEKQPCDDPNKIGKIAEVIRPGYQYFIAEDNIKIVRAAQVKLFG